MNEKELKNELQTFFNEMTRDEVKSLFNDLGFEVEDGEGKIIFTETYKEFHYDVNGANYRINQQNNFKVTNDSNIMMEFDLSMYVA